MSRKGFTLAALLIVLVFRWSVGHLRLMVYNVTRVGSRGAMSRGDGRKSAPRTEQVQDVKPPVFVDDDLENDRIERGRARI